MDSDILELVDPQSAAEATPTTEHPEAPALPPIRVPTRHNPTLATLVERVNADKELITLWRCANVNSVDRMGRSDHGRVHVQIVANIALKVLRLLIEADVQPNVVKDYELRNEDAEVAVFLASVLHDVGIAVHREDHEQHSLFVAAPKAKELLEGLYDVEQRTIIWSEVMNAIISHNRDVQCLTLEAGVVKVADALDMSKGRSRIPFENGQVNIHSLSAAAIEKVAIDRGEERPVRIQIDMSNSSGVFQIDELLKGKIASSGLRDLLEVVGTIRSAEEKRLLKVFRL
ncbi:MAG: HD domain-containing protein [Dehalococcoidales bacterium]|nr:HD domain-containing protein [Dehalococcoidales bacterium]